MLQELGFNRYSWFDSFDAAANCESAEIFVQSGVSGFYVIRADVDAYRKILILNLTVDLPYRRIYETADYRSSVFPRHLRFSQKISENLVTKEVKKGFP